MAQEGCGFRVSLGFRGLGFRGLGFKGLGVLPAPPKGPLMEPLWP